MMKCSIFALLIPGLLLAQNDVSSGTSKPVMVWRFDDGKEPGPRSPAYPGFTRQNTARRFNGDGKKDGLRVKDSEELRFELNETITLEAWVNAAVGDGTPYIIGKGRLGTKEFGAENQNYAMRLQFGKEGAQLGFLFHSADQPGKKGDWHRWWSKELMALGGWHHVAVTYTFGQPKSIKGFIDGRETDGTWDMGGATDRAPTVDGDAVVIGSGSNLTSSHSLDGWLDDVAIYRGEVDDEFLKAKYQFVPPPPPVTQKQVPSGKVLVQLAEEGMPETNAWPMIPPKVGETYTEEVFGFTDVPQKYVDTGVRADRHVPFLLRAAATVTFPKGKHRLLLRARGATNLYLSGKSVLSTPFPPKDSDGHHLVADQEGYLNLGPDFRFVPPGNRESLCEFESTGKPMFIILETLVGSYVGKSVRRAETGETVVAWSQEGTETWQLVTPGSRQVAYTDAGWAAYEKERMAHYDEVNAERRAAARNQHAPYWSKRREAAVAWLAKNPAGEGSVDSFIDAKIAEVSQQASAQGSVDYFKQIQPILEAKCTECHQGSKAKGGLRLDTFAEATKDGAITPGKPEASEVLARIISEDEDEVMPPKGKKVTAEERALLTTWIKEGAHWPTIRADHLTQTEPCDDLTFIRRAYLDTVGVVPTLAEIAAFQAKPDRKALVDALLKDPRWADHWMGYWQDVLAENPNMLNPTLNNTGPFRWWLYESLKDNKPMDLFVTELLRMRGSERLGGPAGFAVASQNDVPMAAKGTIVSTAFLGVEMKCARCHDSPTHKWLQQDLFALAAMLGTKELEVPKTSSVPMDKIHAGGRKPLIQVTLKPGTKVQPKWPFAEFCDESAASLAEDSKDTRDVLAAMITAPQNERFAQVIANRVWARFMGRGIVEPVEDWEKGKPTHPELIRWLGRQLVEGGYDVKHLARLILNSKAYQRATDPVLKQTSPLFTSPAPRRLQAEQIVDSLFAATGKPFRTEEVCLDIDNTRDLKNSINLGKPHRSWMLTSTSNERDRPSLALPRIQAVADVLSAFGWRGSRQDPISRRDMDANVLQPAILSNGTVATWLTRLSDDHGITQLALQDQPLEVFIDKLFLSLLTRHPTEEEIKLYREHLADGFETRISNLKSQISNPKREPEKYVSWSNHLDAEATLIRLKQEADARAGDPPTTKLDAKWRNKLEDVLWAVLNSPEWAFSP
jgi:mono/diheme cytochrome c family protein